MVRLLPTPGLDVRRPLPPWPGGFDQFCFRSSRLDTKRPWAPCAPINSGISGFNTKQNLCSFTSGTWSFAKRRRVCSSRDCRLCWRAFFASPFGLTPTGLANLGEREYVGWFLFKLNRSSPLVIYKKNKSAIGTTVL